MTVWEFGFVVVGLEEGRGCGAGGGREAGGGRGQKLLVGGDRLEDSLIVSDLTP